MCRFMKKTLLALTVAVSLTGQVFGQTLQEAKEAISTLGLTVSGGYLVLEEEAQLDSNVGQLAKLRRDLQQSGRTLATMEKQYSQFEERIALLRRQEVQLNAQLSTADTSNVLVYNRLVGAVNAVNGQLQLMFQQRQKINEQLDAQKAMVGKARETFVQTILDSRELIEVARQKYEDLATNEEAKAALAQYSAATKREFKLGPSGKFEPAIKKIADVEKSLESETIALDGTGGGGTFRVDVVINGKHQQKMVVDSGASFIALPYAMATGFGLTIDQQNDDRILLRIANGDEIQGYPKKLKSVKVGKFIVEDVDCVVLEPIASAAEPLLGMSFLGNFKFELDASQKSLSLMRLDEGAKPR